MTDNEKRTIYEGLLPQARAVCSGEADPIAQMANVCALLHSAFGFWWTGFYRVVGDELVLGPFQGSIACTRIGKGRGVCGTAWQRGETIVVNDVEMYSGHIACSSASKSEIVVPLLEAGKVWAVLDIDSRNLATFNSVDSHYLQLVAQAVVQ